MQNIAELVPIFCRERDVAFLNGPPGGIVQQRVALRIILQAVSASDGFHQSFEKFFASIHDLIRKAGRTKRGRAKMLYLSPYLVDSDVENHFAFVATYARYLHLADAVDGFQSSLDRGDGCGIGDHVALGDTQGLTYRLFWDFTRAVDIHNADGGTLPERRRRRQKKRGGDGKVESDSQCSHE